MSEMSLENQIRCMQDMKEFLGDFCSLMRKEMTILDDQILGLKSQGFSIETEQTYRQRYYSPANNDVEQVIRNIHGRHFEYIDGVIEDLEKAKNR